MIPSTHNRLFGPGGCLTALAMRSYLDGSLRLSGRLQVDEHLKKCKLCSEALDGFRQRGHKSYLQGDLEYLSKRIRRTYSVKDYAPGRRFPVLIILTLGVFILLLISIFYILRQGLNDKQIQHKTTPTEEVQKK
jgi:hypothetical protein